MLSPPGGSHHPILIKWVPMRVCHLIQVDLIVNNTSQIFIPFLVLYKGTVWGAEDIECTKQTATQSCPTLCDPMDCSPPGSLVHGIFQHEYWSGLLFPSLGDLPNPGIEFTPPALQADALLLSHWVSPRPTMATIKERERKRERNGLWLSLLPPLEQGSESEAGKTFLYISLALHVLSTLQSH